MQAQIFAGNDYLRFPQVTGGNLPAPAGNLREAFIDLVRADFQTYGRFLLSSIEQFDQSNPLLPLKSVVNPSKFILFQKTWTVHCWLFNPFSKKKHNSMKKIHYHQNDRELA